jgi:hypothetical protein
MRRLTLANARFPRWHWGLTVKLIVNQITRHDFAASASAFLNGLAAA